MKTKGEKQVYLKGLRDRWQRVKKLLDTGKITEIEAIIADHGLKVSPMGFFFVARQMAEQGLNGLPYLDAKTYMGWQDSGFQVKKGEKSSLSGITWITANGKEISDTGAGENAEADNKYMFPKQYHLFHRSQIEPA